MNEVEEVMNESRQNSLGYWNWADDESQTNDQATESDKEEAFDGGKFESGDNLKADESNGQSTAPSPPPPTATFSNDTVSDEHLDADARQLLASNNGNDSYLLGKIIKGLLICSINR